MQTHYTRHAYNCHGNEVATWFLHCRRRNDCTARWQYCLSCSACWKKKNWVRVISRQPLYTLWYSYAQLCSKKLHFHHVLQYTHCFFFMFLELYNKVLSTDLVFKIEEEIKKKVQNKSLLLKHKEPPVIDVTKSESNALVVNTNTENLFPVKLTEILNPALSPSQQIVIHRLPNGHILSVDMFNKEQLNEIFNLASTLRFYVLRQKPLDYILRVSCNFCQILTLDSINYWVCLWSSKGKSDGFYILRSQYQNELQFFNSNAETRRKSGTSWWN